METELTLSAGGLPPFCARGCRQELVSVEQGQFFRTVNGSLLYCGIPGQKKYRSKIIGEDQSPVATGWLEPGTEIMVGCIQRLWQAVQPGACEITLEKNPVKDSLMLLDAQNRPVTVLGMADKTLHLAKDHSARFLSYRPQLLMRLLSYHLSTQEWQGKVSWVMELEEV